jgi:hypothetical protein
VDGPDQDTFGKGMGDVAQDAEYLGGRLVGWHIRFKKGIYTFIDTILKLLVSVVRKLNGEILKLRKRSPITRRIGSGLPSQVEVRGSKAR